MLPGSVAEIIAVWKRQYGMRWPMPIAAVTERFGQVVFPQAKNGKNHTRATKNSLPGLPDI